MVLVLWELVLFYRIGVECKGEMFSNYSRRVKWQQGVNAGIGLSVHNVLDRSLYTITLVQWCGASQGKLIVQWSGIVAQSESVGLGFSGEIYCERSVENQWGEVR